MNDIVVKMPAEDGVGTMIAPIVEQARALRVTNVDEDRLAQEALAKIGRVRAAWVDIWAEPKATAHTAHKSVCGAEAKGLKPLDEAKDIVNGKCMTYRREQERIAATERARLEAEARKAVEAQATRDAKAAENRALEEARAAEAAGDPMLAARVLDRGAMEARAILAEPVAVPVPYVPAAVAEVDGVTERTTYHAEITNLVAFISWVAQTPGERSYLIEPNMPGLNSLARQQRDAMLIPGVRAVAETKLARTGR